MYTSIHTSIHVYVYSIVLLYRFVLYGYAVLCMGKSLHIGLFQLYSFDGHLRMYGTYV